MTYKHKWMRYTKEDVDEFLKTRNILRIGEYINSQSPFEVQCILDGYTWNPTLNNLLHGFGCHRCSNTERYTNETFDLKIKDRKIIRIDDYKTSSLKINFRCIVCDNIWLAKPEKILTGKGCPKCNGGIKYTNYDFDEKIKNKNLLRLSDYIDYISPITVKCLKCDYIWTRPKATDIMDNKQPCPKCLKVHKPIEQTLLEIKNKNPNIEVVKNIRRMKDKVEWRCLKDNEIFSQSPNGILVHGYGCPYCRKKGEVETKKIIEENVKNYDYYKYQKTVTFNSKRFLVDFFLVKNNKTYIIERNGEQHYEPIRFGGMSRKKANDNFIRQKERDNTLKEYCKVNNIQFIEVPYWFKTEEIINSIKDCI